MDTTAYSRMLRRLAALERRVNALFRTGKVAEIQISPYRARVDIGPDEDGQPVLTDPLPVFVPRSGEVGDWDPLTVGERVSVLAPGGEDTAAFVMAALLSSDFPAVGDAAGNVARRFSVLGDADIEAGRIVVVRGATPAESSMEFKVGLSSLTLWGDGDILLDNGTSSLAMNLTDMLSDSPHVGLND